MAETRRKVWEVQTQLYDTYGQPYIDTDVFLKTLEDLFKAGTIKNYAYILHDKDKYTQEDEEKARAEIEAGSKRKPIKAGEDKPEHIHAPIQFKDAKSLTAAAKILGVTDAMMVYVRENESGELETFDDKCAYLCHERQPDKTPYDYSEIICTFNYADLMARYAVRMKRKGKNKRSRAFRDEHVNAIASGEETVAGFIKTFGYSAYEEGKRHYDNAEQYYLRKLYPGEGLRLTILITGPSTVGKTPLAKFYACSIFKDITNPREVYFSTGDAGATLQGYAGQPVIIWDDYRAIDFIKTFNRNVLFNSLFAVHPDPTDFNIKYGTTVLRHTLNIITCIDDVDTFARELAGEYTDKFGNLHKSEEKQILQAYKRIWGLSEVTEDEIVFLVNQGYYNGDNALYRQYEACARVQNGTRALAERYAPALYGHIGTKMIPEVKQKYDEQVERETGKISNIEEFDPADIPARLPYDGIVKK